MANYPESFEASIPEEVCYIGQYNMTDKAANGIAIGKLLLSPTRTFAPIIKEAVEKYGPQLHGIVHNTGGAHTKSLKYITDPVRLVKDNLFEPPLIFQLIQEASAVTLHEMYQVFNMGTRLELYTDAKTAEAIIAIAASYDVAAQIIGRVEASEQKEVIVVTATGETIQYR